MNTLSQSAVYISSLARTPLLCVSLGSVSSDANFLVLWAHGCSSYTHCLRVPIDEGTYNLSLGHFFLVWARLITGSARWQKREVAQTEHTCWAEFTSDPWKYYFRKHYVTEGSPLVTAVIGAPCFLYDCLAFPFFHQPTAPIYTSLSLYNIILTPWNLHLHTRLHMIAPFIIPPMKKAFMILNFILLNIFPHYFQNTHS